MQRPALASIVLAASIAVPALVLLICLCFPHAVGRPTYVAVYFVPAIGGFLLWVYYRLRRAEPYGFLQGLLDGLVVVLCSLRMTAPLVPMSGHMLLFVYAGITVRSLVFRSIMALLIVETSIIKLVYWGDYGSWTWGTLSGIVMGLVFIKASRAG